MAAHPIEGMIEHQIRRWDLEQRGAATRRIRPCIAISRLAGAGGEALAQRVADRLGYAIFDRQIVDEVARRAGVSAPLVEGLDEHVRSAIERYVVDAFAHGNLIESEYLRHVARIVATCGERGSVVILGRGSAQILPATRALRVLLCGPRALRIARLARERGLDETAAAERVDLEDEARREFLRHHFRVDPSDASNYDLCLNLGTISVDAGARMVVEALHDRFPGGVRQTAQDL